MKQEKKHILIIDDNPDDRELIREFLKRGKLEDSFSFEVAEAYSLDSAIKKIDEKKPDCILLDYLLPDVKGLEALPVLRQKLHSGMCIILLTGGGNEEIVVQAFRGGVMDYLQKGNFMPSELCHSVEVAIHRKEIREELKLKRLELRKSNESLKEANQLLRERQQELIRMQLKTSIAMVDIEKESERKSRELQEAKQLQLSMLPHVSPELPHLDMGMFMKTCVEVGGDYYDYKVDASNNLTVIIGDATGHGVRAGIVVATVKSYFHTMSHDVSPEEMIRRVSEGIRNLQVRNMYMGLTIMRLQGNKLTISSSGMPPLLYYRKATDKVEEILIKGLFLGSSLQEKVETREFEVKPGDVLLAMSDGLPELFNKKKEMLDYERISQRFSEVVAEPAEGIIRAIENLSIEWTDHGDINDDIALLVMKMK